jgi:hypothetical protein
VALTLHYFDPHGNLIDENVAVKFAPGSHAGTILAGHLDSMLAQIGKSTTQVAFATVDNAGNMLSACRKAAVQAVPCICHTLQLIVIAAWEGKDVAPHSGSRTVDDARKLAKFVKKSNIATGQLNEVQKLLGEVWGPFVIVTIYLDYVCFDA